MRAELAAQMQQMLGYLAADCFNGTLSSVGEAMFEAQVQVYIPDLEIEGCGVLTVREALDKLRLSGKKYLLMLHNWAQKDEEPILYGHCNSYLYEVSADRKQVRFGYLRIEVQCLENEGRCVIRSLSVIKLLSLNPWQCALKKENIPLPWVSGNGVQKQDADEYVRLRNLIGRFARYDFRRWPFLMTSEGEICLDIAPYFDGQPFKVEDYADKIAVLAETEAANGEMYLFHISSLVNPVFTIEADGLRAQGHVTALIHAFKGEAFGYTEAPYPMNTRIGICQFVFEKERGLWKIRSVSFEDVLELTDQKYFNKRDFKHSDAVFERPSMPERNDALIHAADVFEIESIIAWWVDYLKRGESGLFPGRFMVNSREEISMNLSNHTFRGYDEIYGRCNALVGPFLEKHPSLYHYPQIHSGNTPVIEFSGEGDYAVGTWYDMAFGNIGGNIFYDEDETQRAYFPGLGVYDHSFVRVDGNWKMYKFRAKISGIWGLESWPFDTRTCGGWASRREKGDWPAPFEEFYYGKNE